MDNIQTIPLTNLSYTLIPVLAVIAILIKWKLNASNALYAINRMLIQLLIIGYCLNVIFASNSAPITLTILAMMVLFASWIALSTVKHQRRNWLSKALLSLLLASGFTLFVIIIAVLELSPWYQAKYTIPLAGMILANSMNSISLAAERFQSEINNSNNYKQARNNALNAALIPIINSLFAVGVVSLPGMMTGQILSGISPFIAVRYQIMVMCMLFASSGLSAACFLSLIKSDFQD